MLLYRSARCCVHLLTALVIWAGCSAPSLEIAAAQELTQVEIPPQLRRVPAKPPSDEPATSDPTAPQESTAAGEAGDSKEQTPEAKSKQKVDRLIARYERVRECTLNLQGKAYEPEAHDGRALLVMDTIEYNVMPGGPTNGNRFLIAQLHVVNLTGKPVTMTRGSVRLKLADEKPLRQAEIAEKIHNYSFDIGGQQTRSFSDVKRPEKRTVPPGTAGSMWIYFGELELGANLPEAEIQVELDGQPLSLDLKSQVRGQLYVTRTDIGPEQSLALIEIGGRLNPAALSILAELLDTLVEQKVVRTVLVWKKGAQTVDSGITNYLYQYAINTGRESRNRGQDPRYPVLNEGMREVHMARHPGSSYSSGSERRVMHGEPVAAVSGALWSALSVLPKPQLLALIHKGHPWVRPAALSAGAAQLSAEDLPLVLAYSRDPEDPMLQLAAVYALQQFGDDDAVSRLLELAESDDKTLTPQAIAGLTQSRYQSGRTALRTLLETAEPEKRLQLLRVIAEHPSPAFADLYYDTVNDAKSPLRVESLRALNAVGHAELIPLLKTCLDDPTESVRKTAFEIILLRGEPELEPMLEERVLARLKEGELTPNIQNYLRRSKHPAAIPMLMERLREKRKEQNERQQLISLLSEIGDQRIGPLLVEIYPDLQDHEKRTVLETLSQIQSPDFLKFAKAGLISKDSSLVYASINTLSQNDSLEAETILIEGYDRLQNGSYYSQLANVLAYIGSDEAEAKLREGRKSQDSQKRLASINGLRYLEQRKPGYQYVYQANYQMRSKKWKEALSYIDNSIEIDDSLAVAHAVKGTILLRMKKTADAERSFARALELDEDAGEAVVGRLRVQLRQGKLAEALAGFDKLRAEFARDNVFEYHAGLLYADAVEMAGRKPELVDTDKGGKFPKGIVERWKSESLSWTSDAVRHGFNDRTLVRNSPEFEILSKHPNFEKAMSGQLPEREIPSPKDESGKDQPEGESEDALEQPKPAGAIKQVGGIVPEKPVIVQPVVIDLPPPPR